MSKGEQPERRMVADDGEPEARPPDIVGAIAGLWRRIGAGIWGLMFTLLPLAFIATGIGMTAWSIYQAMTFRQAPAAVTEVEGGGDEHDYVKVSYAYTVEGREYADETRAEEDDSDYAALCRMKPGEKLTVWYDPARPNKSQRTVQASATPLGFVLFALPFLALGLNQLSVAFRGRPVWTTRRVGQGDPVPGGVLFLVFTGLCCLGTFALMFASMVMPFPADLVLFLAYGLVVIPLVMRGSARLMRRRSRRRRAAPTEVPLAGRREETEDETRDEGNHAPAEQLPSLGKKLALTAAVTVFWCGITGVFMFFAVRPLLRSASAAGWKTTEGVVLLSKVKTHEGDDGDTYKPLVRYRYTVDGRDYTSERYDFMGVSSSDSGYARRVVKAHPKGRRVTVYYDPDRPAEAVLSQEVPGMAYFLLVFLQPFVLVGAAMLIYTATLPARHGIFHRFLRDPVILPWGIPSWGVLRQDVHGLTIRSGGRIGKAVKYLLLGYGATCFLSIFVLAFLVGPEDATLGTLRTVIRIALGVGVTAAVWSLVRRRRSVVTVDQAQRVLRVRSPRRDEQVHLEEIRSWRIRRVRYPAGTTVNNRRDRFLLLEVLIADGRTVPVHAFPVGSRSWKEETQALIRRSQRGLAELTGGRCRDSIIDPTDDSEDVIDHPNNPIEAGQAIAKTIHALRRKESYSDLT